VWRSLEGVEIRRWVRGRRGVGLSVLAVMALVLLSFGADSRADTPNLTGTFYAENGDIVSVQQVGSQVWWMSESVDQDANPHGGMLGPGHVWSHGLASTSVFEGTLSGSTVSGSWVETSRATSSETGKLTLAVDSVTDGSGTHARLTVASGTAPHGAQQYVAGDPVNDMVYQYPDGHFETLDFYSRFQQAKKPIKSSYNDNGDALGLTHTPNELRPYRDQTVFYGQFTTRNASDDETPHVNIPNSMQHDYATFACQAEDGDLDFRIRIDTTMLPSDFTDNSTPGIGWGQVNAMDEGETGYDNQDVVPKFMNIGTTDIHLAAAEQIENSTASYVGVEGVMYAGNKVSGCPSSAPQLFPGWAGQGGNSILVNSRPINGHLPDATSDHCGTLHSSQTALDGLNGLPIEPESNLPCGVPDGYGTEVRVTGALALDCGHGLGLTDSDDEDYDAPDTIGDHTCDQGEAFDSSDHPEARDQNQELHPFYSIDLIECPLGNYPADACPGKTVRPNLTGAWGSLEDGGTTFVRQIGNTVWMLSMRRNRDPIMTAPVNQIPNPTAVFKGSLVRRSDGSTVITGQAVTVPKGSETGGDTTTATFLVDENHKQFTLISSTNQNFPYAADYEKLYEPQEDTTPPTSSLSVGSPKYQATSTSPTYVTSHTPLTIDATDGDTGQGVLALWHRVVPAGSPEPQYAPTVLDQPQENASDTFTLTTPILSLDPYVVEAYATDASGNDSTPNVRYLTLDDVPPSATINQPASTNYTHSDLITLQYAVSDGSGSGVASTAVTLDGQTTTPAGTSLASGQVIDLLNDGIALGPHAFTITSTDNLGNTQTQTVTFTVLVTAESIETDVNRYLAAGKINSKLATALLSKLDAAASARNRGRCNAAAGDYELFIDQVTAQTGKAIDPTAAQILITDAQYLIAHCP
jgi:hypothetical protein